MTNIGFMNLLFFANDSLMIVGKFVLPSDRHLAVYQTDFAADSSNGDRTAGYGGVC